MSNVRLERYAPELPKIVTFDSCDFPIAEDIVDGYKVLKLPIGLRGVFNEENASVVRINSTAVACGIPDFGGRASGDTYSLLPHQDHLDPTGDSRRFLMLSKRWNGARGSSTLIMTRAVAACIPSLAETWITDPARRARLGVERSYDTRFRITRAEYDNCFDHADGYEKVVKRLAGSNASEEQHLAVRLGILGYLIRGPAADVAMLEIVRACDGMFLIEPWERGGVVIIDNSRVFHARFGGNNPPLQRNFCT